MDLQTFVAVAQIVSAFAVTLTLIAVIVSLRPKYEVAESARGRIARGRDYRDQRSGNGVARSWSRARQSDGRLEFGQPRRANDGAFLSIFFFKLLENAWYQQRAGILDEAQWVGWETLLRKYYHAEGIQRAWWPARKNGYSPEFQKFLSETKPPEQLTALNELFS